MNPAALQPASFAAYPPSARTLAVAHLPLLRLMPLALLPSFLVQIESYPTLFPVEADRLALQLDTLQTHPALTQAFAAIQLPRAMEQTDWLGKPAQWVAMLAGVLWQTGQIDAYHHAAETLFAALPEPARNQTQPPMLLAAIGRDASPSAYPLFTRLREQGLYARHLDPTGAPEALTALLARRAHQKPTPYTHWYIDGGTPWPVPPSAGRKDAPQPAAAPEPQPSPIQQFTFPQLAPVTAAVLREMDQAVRQGTGPELLADHLRAMRPEALHLPEVTADPRLARFLLSLLAQGSGTQLYSTSFVQTAAVELIRRAQPQTLLLRFAPRRRSADLNDMLDQHARSEETDAQGALIDADMAVYYAWLAMQRLPGGDEATLVVYVEGQNQAFIAGPSVTKDSETATTLCINKLIEMLS